MDRPRVLNAFESEVVRIWTFDGGKAVRVRSYYDTGVYARAFDSSRI
jgi:ketosteroid isomerase-like protein